MILAILNKSIPSPLSSPILLIITFILILFLKLKIFTYFHRWRMYGCKAPYHLCWNALIDEDDWIFSHINVSSHYILL